jgi:hypothetical protein
MTRAHHANSVDIEWMTVSVRRPCPVCGGSLQCQLQLEGAFAACSKRPSDWPMTSGAWLHRIDLPAPSTLAWDALDRESGVSETRLSRAAVRGARALEAVRDDAPAASTRAVGTAS